MPEKTPTSSELMMTVPMFLSQTLEIDLVADLHQQRGFGDLPFSQAIDRREAEYSDRAPAKNAMTGPTGPEKLALVCRKRIKTLQAQLANCEDAWARSDLRFQLHEVKELLAYAESRKGFRG